MLLKKLMFGKVKNIDIVKIENIILEINDMIKDVDIPKYDKTSPYFIYNNYTEAGPDGRMYLSMKNGYRIDKVRHEITRLQSESLVNSVEYNLLLKIFLNSFFEYNLSDFKLSILSAPTL